MQTKALVVDDSPISRRVVSLLLRNLKVSSKEALNGKDALRILKNDPSYDLVMLDWNMPQMNGLELLRELRARPNCSHIKLIIVSANDTMDFSNVAKRAGADDFIIKPVNQRIIQQKLRLHGLN